LNEKLISIKKVLDGGFVKSQQLGKVNFGIYLMTSINYVILCIPNDDRLKGLNLHHFKCQKCCGS